MLLKKNKKLEKYLQRSLLGPKKWKVNNFRNFENQEKLFSDKNAAPNQKK